MPTVAPPPVSAAAFSRRSRIRRGALGLGLVIAVVAGAVAAPAAASEPPAPESAEQALQLAQPPVARGDAAVTGLVEAPASVGSSAFVDGPGSVPVEGATVVLTDSTGVIVGEPVTDADGRYVAGGLPGGELSGTVLPPAAVVGEDESIPLLGVEPTTVDVVAVEGRTTEAATVVFGSPIAGTVGDATSAGTEGLSAAGATEPVPGDENAAAAAGTGLAAGLVTTSTGIGIPGAQVTVFAESGRYAGGAWTGSRGEFTVTDLAPGTYTARFNAPGYVPQWFTAARTMGTATLFTVRTGASRDGVDATLVPGSTVSGTVRRAPTGDASARSAVFLFDETRARSLSATLTDESGHYSFTGVSASAVTVRFGTWSTSRSTGTWYDGDASDGRPVIVDLVAGAVTSGIDAELPAGGTITATLAVPASAFTYIPSVSLHSADTGTTYAGSNYDPASRTLTISGVPAGRYSVGLGSSAGVAPAWLGGGSSLADARKIEVIDGATVTVPETTLVLGSTISGRVTGGGAPLANVYIGFGSSDSVWHWSATTDAQGRYSVTGLPTGAFVGSFMHFEGGGSPWATQFSGGATQRSSAVPTVISTSGSTVVDDETLTRASTVTGRVTTAATGAGLGGAAVTVSTPEGQSWSALTGTDGRYSVGGLPAGSYRVSAQMPGLESNLARQWWPGAPSAEEGGAITVPAAGTRAGTDFALSTGRTMSGTVKNAAGEPVAPVSVSVFREGAAGFAHYQTLRTDARGRFTMPGLPNGRYTLGFADYTNSAADGPEYDEVYRTEFWRDSATLESAKAVTIGGADVTGIDAVIARAGDPTALVDRLAGDDRYATAVAISKAGHPSTADTVYLAVGTSFPDALSAAPAAALRDAPLLLTESTRVPAVVADEIRRLKPKRIIVVGGAAAVSDAVLATLRPLAPRVTRVSGADRYATSRAVVADAFGSGSTTVFVATGENFPDALAASAAAGAASAPVLLVPGQASGIDTGTSTALTKLGASSVVIAGGVNAVSAGVQRGLTALPASVVRLSGADRYATAAAINKGRFSSADRVFVATGANFPDALAGAALAGSASAPLYVVPGNCVPRPVLSELRRLTPDRVTLLGGATTLGAGVAGYTACD